MRIYTNIDSLFRRKMVEESEMALSNHSKIVSVLLKVVVTINLICRNRLVINRFLNLMFIHLVARNRTILLLIIQHFQGKII